MTTPASLRRFVASSLLQPFGLQSYRPLQAEAIDAILHGRDLLAVMPTGSGKSLCYQAPATRTGGILVISPLIALMQDQVAKLEARRVHLDAPAASSVGCVPDAPSSPGGSAADLRVPCAAAIHSRLHPREVDELLLRWSRRELDLLYVSPERCASPAFLAALRKRPPSCIVVDEAHCIAQWGHDFRPEYRQLGLLRRMFPKASMAAFTATATREVREEIRLSLNLNVPYYPGEGAGTFLLGNFDRPNLDLAVVDRWDVTQVQRQIAEMLNRADATPAIIYCPTRAWTENLASLLPHEFCPTSLRRFVAFPYHAERDDREEVQAAFMNGEVDVVCATIAFGMGIDHPSVRSVIHVGMPSSLEQYHQEIGRAGRDGQPARCTILYSPNDLDAWIDRFRIDPDRISLAVEECDGWVDADDPAAPGRLLALCKMADFCESDRCRHRMLVEYFSGRHSRSDQDSTATGMERSAGCNACDNCRRAS